MVFFCRYASFIWVLNSFFFVAVAVFNNLGHAGYSTAISWLRATVGTLPLVWLGARLGGPRAWCWVSRPVSRCSAWWRWRCAGACCAGLLPGRRRLPPDSHRRLDFIIGTRYDRG